MEIFKNEAVIPSLQLFPKLFPNYTTEGKVERKDRRCHELSVDHSWLLPAFNCPGWWDPMGRENRGFLDFCPSMENYYNKLAAEIVANG